MSFCVFDLETTGGNQKTDKIIEIGLVKISNLEIVDQKDFLIKPEIPIPDFIQRLTSITHKKTAKSPIIEEVIDEVVEFMSDSILVAHNTSFDVPFFNSVLERLGKKKMENRTICTNLMTKYLIPGLMNSNLNYMSNIFGIGHQRAHRAKDDAYATALLLLKYLNIFIEKDIKKINHLYYPKNRYELDRASFKRDGITTEKLVETLSKSGSDAFSLSLKGDQGEICFAIADTVKGFEEDFYSNVISTVKWKTATINLFGNLPEAFFSIRPFFKKINKEETGKILDYVARRHLGFKTFDDLIKQYDAKKRKRGFLIIHHLVPEQFVVINLVDVSVRDKLVFRYPGHEKKLWQYLKSRSKVNSKKKKAVLEKDEILEMFLCTYLKSDIPGLYIDSSEIKSGSLDLDEQLCDYISNVSNPNDYPRSYI
jgi:DNA polymerase-3 subunit alpha (Gram-positive type)